MTGCVAVASSFLPAAELAAVLNEYAPALQRAGVSFAMSVGEGDGAHEAVLRSDTAQVFFVVTGGTERQVLDIVERQGALKNGAGADAAPVILVAYPGRNSLPASLEVLARLQQDGVSGRIVFLDGAADTHGIERLLLAVSEPGVSGAKGDPVAAAVPGRGGPFSSKPPGSPLAGRRMGLIGEPSDWLVASSPSAGVVRDVWGAEIIRIELEEVVRRMELDPGRARAFAGSFAAATECREPSASDLDASGHIYVALRSLIEDHGLDALTVRCFDLVTGIGATGCLALSRLTDEGVIAGCEGDLVSALGLLWARDVTGETPWMANPARVDVAANALTLAHCTVPCSIVDSYALRSHFESGLGAAVAGVIPAGPVTLLRIGGKRLDRVWVARGEVIGSGCDERMCRTQVDVRLGGGAAAADASVANLLEQPLGNHLVLIRGHHELGG